MTYDAANQATQYALGGTTTAITYDNQGNRLIGPAPTTGTSTYSWNQAQPTRRSERNDLRVRRHRTAVISDPNIGTSPGVHVGHDSIRTADADRWCFELHL
ncbi:hypothetical protein J3A64_003247 [Pseudarthrobacter sp. PvP004]|uniref:hypothetical protein n=1 Tax=Pseudarthrobacter sp. PvP004 TaxID=2817850 RepID=UPI001AEB3BE4|nr:hypothetical protein [Pseudarthrobacter sp. PvP004]MBP2267783.1 hypothetical protein [Pseudarthrobacter sp. PvP004]